MIRLLIILCLVLGLAARSGAQTYDELRTHIVAAEGYRVKQYMVRGIPHIGIGHRVYRPTGSLTRYQVEALFAKDLKVACAAAYLETAHFSSHPKQVRIMLCALAFSVGPTGYHDFTRFRAAIDRYDYRAAAYELRQSAWSRQLPNRAARYDLILLSVAR